MGIGGFTSHHPSYRGRTDEWLTPPEIIKALGEFDLDPCSPSERPWPTAKEHFTIKDDGLKKEWFGKIFLNPPYGPQTAKWLKKMAEHGNGVALIFARTETRMFFSYVWEKAQALLFIRGRLSFYEVSGRKGKINAGAPSVLIAYGDDNANKLQSCGIAGHFVRLR